MSAMTERLSTTLNAIDAANAQDPRRVLADGREQPFELVYGRRMSETLGHAYPDASDLLQIAVRAQHIERWKIPRSDYAMDKAGYHAWRNAQKARHADVVGAIMAAAGYRADEIVRVGAIVRKERLKRDADAQALEDVACLVFMSHYFDDFARQHDTDKIVDIVRKTWAKMSPHGQGLAKQLPLEPHLAAIVDKALEPAPVAGPQEG